MSAQAAQDLDGERPESRSVLRSGVVYALLFGAVGTWPPYSSVYFQSLGIDLGQIGVLSAVPAAVAIVAAPIWGMISDRLGDVRPPLLVATAWASVLALVLAAQPPVVLIGILVAIMAAGSAAIAPLIDARTIQRLGRDRERYGQARLWGSISFIAVSIGTGILIAASTPRVSLVAYALLVGAGGVVGVLLLGRGRRTAGVPTINRGAVGRLLRDPQLRLFFVGAVIVWTAANGIMTFFSLRILQLGGDAQLVGIGWAVNALAEVPVMFGFAWLARRVGVPRLMIAGGLVFAVRAAGWALVGSATDTVAVTMLGGIGYALFVVGTTAFVSARAPAELRATAQGLFMGTTYAMGSILGSILAGLLAGQAGLAAVFPAGIAASLVGALVVWQAIGRGPASVAAAMSGARARP